MAGRANGSAVVTLEPRGEGGGQTLLTYRAESQIGGRLAQIGSRLIDATVVRMSNQFFDRFQQVVQDPALLDGPGAAAGASVASVEPPATPAHAAAPARAAAPSGLAAAPMLARDAGGVTIQMPGWVFTAALSLGALLIGWLAVN